MTTHASPLRIESRLSDDIQALVMDYLEESPDSKKDVAKSLKVPEASIDALMKRPRWEPGLTLRIAEALDLEIKVVRDL